MAIYWDLSVYWVSRTFNLRWEHYLIHSPEPHIFLFKRSIKLFENPRKRRSIAKGSRLTKAKYDPKILESSNATTSNDKNRRRSLRIANQENY